MDTSSRGTGLTTSIAILFDEEVHMSNKKKLPPPHNIPVGTEEGKNIRDIFAASNPREVLVHPSISQLEMRVVSSMDVPFDRVDMFHALTRDRFPRDG